MTERALDPYDATSDRVISADDYGAHRGAPRLPLRDTPAYLPWGLRCLSARHPAPSRARFWLRELAFAKLALLNRGVALIDHWDAIERERGHPARRAGVGVRGSDSRQAGVGHDVLPDCVRGGSVPVRPTVERRPLDHSPPSPTCRGSRTSASRRRGASTTTSAASSRRWGTSASSPIALSGCGGPPRRRHLARAVVSRRRPPVHLRAGRRARLGGRQFDRIRQRDQRACRGEARDRRVRGPGDGRERAGGPRARHRHYRQLAPSWTCYSAVQEVET